MRLGNLTLQRDKTDTLESVDGSTNFGASKEKHFQDELQSPLRGPGTSARSASAKCPIGKGSEGARIALDLYITAERWLTPFVPGYEKLPRHALEEAYTASEDKEADNGLPRVKLAPFFSKIGQEGVTAEKAKANAEPSPGSKRTTDIADISGARAGRGGRPAAAKRAPISRTCKGSQKDSQDGKRVTNTSGTRESLHSAGTPTGDTAERNPSKSRGRRNKATAARQSKKCTALETQTSDASGSDQQLPVTLEEQNQAHTTDLADDCEEIENALIFSRSLRRARGHSRVVLEDMDDSQLVNNVQSTCLLNKSSSAPTTRNLTATTRRTRKKSPAARPDQGGLAERKTCKRSRRKAVDRLAEVMAAGLTIEEPRACVQEEKVCDGDLQTVRHIHNSL